MSPVSERSPLGSGLRVAGVGIVDALLAEAVATALRSPALTGTGMTGALADGPATIDAAVVRVLDCGGGSGRYAVPLASAGAEVTVVDVSADALSTLRRRALEAKVAERVRGVQGDVEELDAALREAAAQRPFELVLAHGILEVVDHASATFAAIAGEVRPGGLLSILVSNPVAGVLARALAGDLAAAERELTQLDDLGGNRMTPAVVQALCAEHGLIVEQRHGIAVFGDLVPGQALDEPGGRDALARLERACAQRAPFADMAAFVHVLARRSEGLSSDGS